MNIKEIMDAQRRTDVEKEAAKPPNTWEHDDCCSKHLARYLKAKPDSKTFECPKCACEWEPRRVAGMRHWSPDSPLIEIMKLRG